MTPAFGFNFEWWTIFLAGLSTLAIYSFLYRENSFYRFFEHLFIGIATGIGVMMTIKNFLWPQIVKPMIGLDRVPFPDGTYAEPYNEYFLLYLAPIIFGSLYYFILSKRYNWLAQVVIGFQLGVSGGLAFRGTFNEMMPQLQDSFRTLIHPELTWHMLANFTEMSAPLLETFSNIVFIFTLITTLSYFFFTFGQSSNSGIASKSAVAGRWMMMVCFGAFFGSTIMARMALLVERLEFLINKWLPLFGF